MHLDEKNKIKLLQALETDTNLDFDSEFVRTTDLEVKIIKQYDFEGIKLIIEKEFPKSELYELGKFPERCPYYHLNSLTLSQIIRLNFKPITDRIPDLIQIMEERCLSIFFEKTETNCYLNYVLGCKLYDGRDYYRIYKGGMPNLNPVPNQNLSKYNWTLPEDLKSFYQIHDGFGEIYDCNFILSSNEIRIMAELMDPICKDYDNYPEKYQFKDLLEFFPDGSGNCECFFRNAKGNNITVDWDHETWELDNQKNFFEFINKSMSELDEE